MEEDRKVACIYAHLFLICFICPFICHTIAQNTFYVQLVVRSNFNRLQRKYECFYVCCKKCWSYINVLVEN